MHSKPIQRILCKKEFYLKIFGGPIHGNRITYACVISQVDTMAENRLHHTIRRQLLRMEVSQQWSEARQEGKRKSSCHWNFWKRLNSSLWRKRLGRTVARRKAALERRLYQIPHDPFQALDLVIYLNWWVLFFKVLNETPVVRSGKLKISLSLSSLCLYLFLKSIFTVTWELLVHTKQLTL